MDGIAINNGLRTSLSGSTNYIPIPCVAIVPGVLLFSLGIVFF